MAYTGDTEAFDTAYARLNPAQKQAVDTIEGPVMVIAGPGTGKTQILALRIANILRRTDADPSSILALTFTESGVASMRTRLIALIGEAGYRVRVHTFHGFSNEVIRRYPDRFPDIIGRTPLVELDAVAIVREILDRERPALLRPHGDPDFYVRDIIGKLSEVKREHVSPTMLHERVTRERAAIESAEDLTHQKGVHVGKVKGKYATALRSLAKAAEFADVYAAYEEALHDRRHYDFEDTIIAVIEALSRDEELKLILQEEHQYVLADEHQDANGGQNELLVLLSDFHAAPNLFVVGDEKQAIYRFQGASLENFFSFKRRYPAALSISLTDNYRSTQRILDAAHTLIAPAVGHESIDRPELRAAAGHEEQIIRGVAAPDEDTEHADVAARIAALVEAGTPPGEIAILVRRNGDVPLLAAALVRRDVSHVAHGDDPVLAHPVVQGIVSLLRAVATPGDDAVLYRALTLPYSGVTNADLYRLAQVPHGTLLIEVLKDGGHLERAGVRDADACTRFAELVDRAARGVGTVPLIICVEQLLWRSGAMAHIMAHTDALPTLERVRAFFRYLSTVLEAHPEYTLAELLGAIDAAQTYRLSIAGRQYGSPDAVAIMTVHRAKGMEFDHVFVPHVHDRMWGGRSRSERLPLPLFAPVADAAEDDERRLFYVAMTRARKTLTLSHAARTADGTRLVPSRYLAELTDFCAAESAEALGADFFVPPAEGARETLTSEEREYLCARIAEQGLSVTALNNYRESPWKYFFLNLLRIPSARPAHLLYGSAVDAALKWYTDERAGGNVPAADDLVRIFARELSRMPLSRKDLETYRARGDAALRGYHALYATEWVSRAESAVRIAVPFDTGIPEMPTITLRGELDKVEIGEGDVVCIVDYKTGKPKTRGEIEGTTKTSEGNLKRQLVFYRLLVELDESREWRAEEAMLDFVEPDQRGKYRRERFSITREDTDALTVEIRAALAELVTFGFWERPCDAAAWSEEGCALASAFRARRGLFPDA